MPHSTKKINLYKFFDYFGIIIFLFIFLEAAFYIKLGTANLGDWLRLLIGIGGLLVDGFLVFFYKEKD